MIYVRKYYEILWLLFQTVMHCYGCSVLHEAAKVVFMLKINSKSRNVFVLSVFKRIIVGNEESTGVFCQNLLSQDTDQILASAKKDTGSSLQVLLLCDGVCCHRLSCVRHGVQVAGSAVDWARGFWQSSGGVLAY